MKVEPGRKSQSSCKTVDGEGYKFAYHTNEYTTTIKKYIFCYDQGFFEIESVCWHS